MFLKSVLVAFGEISYELSPTSVDGKSAEIVMRPLDVSHRVYAGQVPKHGVRTRLMLSIVVSRLSGEVTAGRVVVQPQTTKAKVPMKNLKWRPLRDSPG